MLLSLRLTHLLTTDTAWVTDMASDMVMAMDTQHTDMVTLDTHTDTLERDQPMPSQKPRLMLLLLLKPMPLLTTDTVLVTDMVWVTDVVMDTQHTDMVTPDTHTDTLERDLPMPSQKPRLMLLLLLKPLPLLTTDTVLVTDMVWDTDMPMDTQHTDMVTLHTHTDTLESDPPMLSQKPRLMPLLMLTTDMDMATTHKPMVMVMATPMVVTVDTTMDKELKNVETIFFQNCF